MNLGPRGGTRLPLDCGRGGKLKKKESAVEMGRKRENLFQAKRGERRKTWGVGNRVKESTP